MEKLPRIGVTLWDDVPQEARNRYTDRVAEAGAEPVILAEDAAGRAAELAQSLEGLMLTGGIDVDPAKYGVPRHIKVKEVDGARDDMELAMLDACLQRDIPVLAICRGHQLLNVGFGGALLQHIDSGEHRADFKTEGHPSRWHELTVVEDSRLAGMLGGERIEINSRHHQAVTADVLGAGLRPVAFADDHGHDLIEGMESEQHGWVVSVQWHPERPEPHKPDFAPVMRRLFDAFVKQARSLRV